MDLISILLILTTFILLQSQQILTFSSESTTVETCLNSNSLMANSSLNISAMTISSLNTVFYKDLCSANTSSSSLINHNSSVKATPLNLIIRSTVTTGNIFKITWSSNGLTSDTMIHLDLYLQNNFLMNITSNAPILSENFIWAVPMNIATNTNYYIKATVESIVEITTPFTINNLISDNVEKSASKQYRFTVPTGYHFYAKLHYDDSNFNKASMYLREHEEATTDIYDQVENDPDTQVGFYNCEESSDSISSSLLVHNGNRFYGTIPYILTVWIEEYRECSSTEERSLAILTTNFSVISYDEIQRSSIVIPFMGQCEEWNQNLFYTSISLAHVEGYVNVKRNWILLSFKGTSNAVDAVSDLDAIRVNCNLNSQNCGEIHEGFHLRYSRVQSQVWDFLNNFGSNTIHYDLFITGHSLGAAMGTIAALDIATSHTKFASIHLRTIGSPRVGNMDFVNIFNQFLPVNDSMKFMTHIRYVHHQEDDPTRIDPITTLPSERMGFMHIIDPTYIEYINVAADSTSNHNHPILDNAEVAFSDLSGINLHGSDGYLLSFEKIGPNYQQCMDPTQPV